MRKANGRLEKANRRITWVSLALGAMLVLVFALAAVKPAATQDVIRAKKLEIVDDKGNARIAMEMAAITKGDPAYPLLRIYDEKGNRRETLGVDANGPFLRLFDENDAPRAGLRAGDAGPAVMLADEKGKSRAGISFGGKEPALWLLDKDGHVIWQAPPK